MYSRRQIYLHANKDMYRTLGPMGQMSIHGSMGVETFVPAEANMEFD